MTLVTDAIKYNVRDRGRKHRGVARNFDTAALARLINSPAVQEKVKHGDMLGYFGHWPRVKFGMEVTEGGIDRDSGKAIVLPTAIRTLEISADPDGTITHRAEFLETEAGKVAQALYKSKAGGFSSAIDCAPRTSPALPRGFYGFDYVYEPNFTENRGHKVVLDSVGEEVGAILDAVMEQAAAEQSEMLALFDSLASQHELALEALDHMTREREWAIGRLAAIKREPVEQVVDSIALEGIAAQRSQSPGWEQYRSVPLVSLVELPKAASAPSPEVERAARQYGVKL